MPAPRTSSTRRSARRAKPVLTAATADKQELYEAAVQTPDLECDFFDRVYRKLNGEKPATLREDFCSTAAICQSWVKRRKTNRAWAIDLDPSPLEWARRKRLPRLTDDQRARLSLVEADVLKVPKAVPKVDVVSAGNFSWWVFKSRDVLRGYFKGVRGSLTKGGVFVLDLCGGNRSMDELKEPRRCRGFTYVWEQHSFDPITADYTCFIHFRFKKGPPMLRAFRYDWRLWTIPETLEILHEAGFKDATVYWEDDDAKGGGSGVFRPAKKGENCEGFIAYVVAHG